MNSDKMQPWSLCRRAILKQANEMYTPPILIELENQVSQLMDDFRSTIIDRESKSQLLLGPSGSGKSVAIRKVINILRHELQQKEEAEGCVDDDRKSNFKVLELFTYMYDDNNSILKAIARQLGVPLTDWEHAVETMSSLSVPLIVILDPMETFSEQSRPTVIYTLLDAMQRTTRGVLVLGISRRVDVLETLERRVRSRFSTGNVVFYGYSNISTMISILSNILTLPDDFPDKAFASEWSTSIQKVLASRKIQDILTRITMDAGDARKIQLLVNVAMYRLSEKNQFITIEALEQAATNICRDKRAEMIKGLPEETLGLLVSAKRLAQPTAGPALLKLDTIISHYYAFMMHTLDHAKMKNQEAETKEHLTDAARTLVTLGLFHLHGASSILHPYSTLSLRFDPNYLTSVIDGLDTNTALQKWARTWLE